MLLGDMIARFDDEATALQMLLSLDDLALIARLREICEQEGCSVAEFARRAVHIYAASASDDEWVTAIGVMGRTQAPGRELLRRALIWTLDSHRKGAGATTAPRQSAAN